MLLNLWWAPVASLTPRADARLRAEASATSQRVLTTASSATLTIDVSRAL